MVNVIYTDLEISLLSSRNVRKYGFLVGKVVLLEK